MKENQICHLLEKRKLHAKAPQLLKDREELYQKLQTLISQKSQEIESYKNELRKLDQELDRIDEIPANELLKEIIEAILQKESDPNCLKEYEEIIISQNSLLKREFMAENSLNKLVDLFQQGAMILSPPQGPLFLRLITLPFRRHPKVSLAILFREIEQEVKRLMLSIENEELKKMLIELKEAIIKRWNDQLYADQFWYFKSEIEKFWQKANELSQSQTQELDNCQQTLEAWITRWT